MQLKVIFSKLKKVFSLENLTRFKKIGLGLLSVAVVVTVCASLIKPAISYTEFIPSDFSDFTPDKGVSLYGHVTNIVVDNFIIPVDDNTNKYKFTLEYDFTGSDDGRKFAGGSESEALKYIYLQLPEEATFLTGAEFVGEIRDANYPNGPAGYYYVNSDGLFVIKFTDEYLDYPDVAATGIKKGNFIFDAQVIRNSDYDSDTFVIDIAGKDVPLPGFKEISIGFSKEGTFNSDTGDIDWAVSIENKTNSSMEGYKISDTMFGDHSNVKFYVGDQEISASQFGAWNSDGTFTFNANATQYTNISIKYTTEITDEDVKACALDPSWDGYFREKVKNVLEYSKGEDTPTKIEKEVTYDFGYHLDSKVPTVDYATETIAWSIAISNKYGHDMTGVVITDEAFATDAFEKNEDGTIKIADGLYGTLDGNKLTLTDNRAVKGDVTINYIVDAQANTKGKNKATFNLPDDPKHTTSIEKDWSFKPVEMTKSGSSDKNNGILNWQINVNVQSESAISLKDFVVKDDMFQYAEETSFTVDSNGIPVDFEFDDDGNLVILGDCKNVIIKYITNFEDNDIPYTTYNNTNQYKNTAEIGIGGDKYADASKTLEVKYDNSVEKSCINENVVVSNDYNTVTIPWRITIKQEKGGFVDKTFTDITSADNENSTHIITPEQLENLSIYCDNDTNNMLSNDDYTIDYTDGVLTIHFNDTEKIASIKRIDVRYETTLDVTDVEVGTTIKAKNKAQFNDKSTEPEYPYRKEDFSTPPYKKTIGGKDSLYIEYEELENYPTITIDDSGDKYLKFDWVVTLTDPSQMASINHMITDTMPSGFSLYGKPMGKIGINTFEFGNGYNSSYNVSGQVISFYCYQFQYYSNLTLEISYSTIVKADDFINAAMENADEDEVYTVTNSAKSGDFKPDEASIDVGPKIEEPTGDSIIDKTGDNSVVGEYSFEIDINPDELTLNGGNPMTLKDVIKNNLLNAYSELDGHVYGEESSDAGDAFDVYLSHIKLYYVDDNGAKTECRNWSYTIDTNPEPVITKTAVECNLDTENNYYTGDGYMFSNDPLKAFEVTLHAESLENTQKDVTYFARNQYNNMVEPTIVSVQFDADGYATFTIPEKFQNNDEIQKLGFVIYNYSGGYTASVKSVETDTSLANLTVTGIPDQKHLKLVYTYKGAFDTTNMFVNAMITNSASLMGNTSSESGEFAIQDKSSGEVETERHMALKKVDIGQNELTLSAGFYLYKYDAEQEKWLIATQVVDEAGNGVYKVTTWADAEEAAGAEIVTKADVLFDIYLDSNTLYKLVENKTPNEIEQLDDTYIQLTKPKYFAFLGYNKGIPSEITKEDIDVIIAMADYPIANAKYVDIGVKKAWGDGADNKSSAQVKVELYRSFEKVDNGFPDESKLEKVRDTEILNNENAWCCKWTDLENGDGDSGKPYYYYVKEIAYNLNGEAWVEVLDSSEYKPVYSANNGTNGDEVVTITNLSKLRVEKIWRNSTQDDHESIQFMLYTLDENGEKLYFDNATYTLSGDDNNWAISIDTSKLTIDGEPNTYTRFYVEETPVPTGYLVEYSNNGATSTEIIQIFNRPDLSDGKALPKTGGAGTMMMVAAGVVLSCGSGTLLINKSRQKTGKPKIRKDKKL